MPVKRAVVCSAKETRLRSGTAHTPDYDPELEEEEQRPGAKVEYVYVYVAFDDVGDPDDLTHVQRNSYYLNLTPEEAEAYEVDGVYMLTVG